MGKSLKEKALELATGGDDEDKDGGGANLTVAYKADDQTEWTISIPATGDDIDDALKEAIKAGTKALDDLKYNARMSGQTQPPQHQWGVQSQYQAPQAGFTAAAVPLPAPALVPAAPASVPQVINHGGVDYMLIDGALIPLPQPGGTGQPAGTE